MVTPGYAGSALTGQLFISLLNPAIGLLFAAAFFLLLLQRRERYVAWAAGAYVATAFAFLIQAVAPALPMELQRLPSSEARRVGKEYVRTRRARWSPYPLKKKTI